MRSRSPPVASYHNLCFCLFILGFSPSKLRRQVASSPLPSAQARLMAGVGSHQGVSKGEVQGKSRPKRKGRGEQRDNKTERAPIPYSSLADAMNEGVGRNSGSSLAPDSLALTLRSSSRSLHSEGSHSDTSLPFRHLAPRAPLGRN